MRTAVALVIAGIVAASLSACSTTIDNGDCTPAASGSVSESVTATGDSGSEPTVKFSAPLSVKKTQRTVEVAAEKRTQFVRPSDEVTFGFVLYNGTTGVKLTSSYTEEGGPAVLVADKAQTLAGLVTTLLCSAPGDRVVGVIPPEEAFGDSGSANLQVAGGESLVVVADIISIVPGVDPTDLPTAATGEPQPPVEGMPTVTLAKDGTPTVTIPATDPPAGLQIAVLKKGDGATVGDGDTVSAQYLGMNWNTGAIFDQSWDDKVPLTIATNQLIPGFTQALVGQTVGSQVLVVIPPELGYGPSGGTPDGSIGATDTIVFVIDILATSAAG